MERMVANFAGSEFVTEGHLQAIEEIESVIASGSPGQGLINSLRGQVETTDTAIEKLLFKVDTDKGKRYSEVDSQITNLQAKRHKYQLSMKQYQIESRPLLAEKNALSEFAERVYAEQNPESYKNYKTAIVELAALNVSARDWADDQATERGVRLQKGKRSFIAADLESENWAGVVNEFDEQRFSRSELQRWVTENGQQSQYQFASIVKAPQEKPLSTTERNSLLRVIAALCDYSNLRPETKGLAGKIMSMTDEIGSHVDDGTVLKILKQIPGALKGGV